MARLTQQQANALLVLRAKIDPRHPGFRGDEKIREALEHCRNYLDSWVYPLIDAIEGNTWHGQHATIAQDAERVRGAITDDLIQRARGTLAAGEQILGREVR